MLVSRVGVSGRVVNVGVRWVGVVKVMVVNFVSIVVVLLIVIKNEKFVVKFIVLVVEKLGVVGIELLEKVVVVDCLYNLF